MSTTDNAATVGVSYADQLRALADLLDEHPELVRYQTLDHTIFVDDVNEAVALRRGIGGHWNKVEVGSTYLDLRRPIGPDVCVSLTIRREQACERVQVGEREVTVPDPDAPKVTLTEPVYEWRCSPLLEGAAS